jgi:hypothetical protein
VSMTLIDDVDTTTTTLHVSEAPPAWLHGSFLATIAAITPAHTVADGWGFELVRVTGYDAESAGLTVLRGAQCELSLGDQTTYGHSGLPHKAGQSVSLGVTEDFIANIGVGLQCTQLGKFENRRLERMQRRARPEDRES